MHKNHRSLSVFSFGSVLLALSVGLGSAPAYAGFQWVSPPQAQEEAPAMPAPVAPAPSSSRYDSFPQPQIIEGKPVPLTAPPKAAPAQAEPAAPAPIVRGFADKVPLSVALRQVLPEGTGFSVAQDVSLGTLVSWKGGASWQKVAADMLEPIGLTFQEKGGLVQIVHAKGTPSTAARSEAGASAPAALLPPIGEVSARTIPDRNMPSGQGGILGVPTTPSVPVEAPQQPMLGSSLPPIMTPYATDTAPYAQDKAVSAWTANKGDTLQSVLEDWSKRANVELSWQAEYDYPVQASVSLSGSFEGAVRSLLAGFQDANPQPVGYLYNNQAAGQTVLVVQVRGNSYNE